VHQLEHPQDLILDCKLLLSHMVPLDVEDPVESVVQLGVDQIGHLHPFVRRDAELGGHALGDLHRIH